MANREKPGFFDQSRASNLPGQPLTSSPAVETLEAAQWELESLRLLFSARSAPFAAFDENGNLTVGSLDQARLNLSSLQKIVGKFERVFTLLPELAVDETYNRTREKWIRQLVHQGNCLASYETQEMIATIKHAAYANRLNRGLSLSLPYFDDWALEMKTYHFEVIPRGRILFEDYYVMWAARYEIEKVQQDNRLSPNARRQLVVELKALERAFEVPWVPPYRQPARKSFQAWIAALRLSLSTMTMIATKKDKET